MAKKTTKKYRQAKKAARPAAKAAFPGKTKAVRRDPLAKYSAEDRQIFKDINKEIKGGYITDDKGNKIQVKPTETARERIARENAAAMRKFREGAYTSEERAAQIESRMAANKKAAMAKQAADKAARAGKPAPTLQQTASTPKSQTTKVFKPRSTNTPAKPMPKTAKGKANYGKYGTADEYAIEKNLEKESKKPATKKAAPKKATAATKPAVKKPAAKTVTKNDALKFSAKGKVDRNKSLGKTRPTDASLTANEDAYLKKTQEKLIKQGKLSGSKEVAIRPKGPVATVTKGGKEVVTTGGKATIVPSKAAKAGKLAKAGKFFKRGIVLPVLAAEMGSAIKGSTEKDWREIQRLENKLAVAQGKKPKYKNMGSNKNPIESSKADLSNLAALVSMGAVGKTRRERMDELNAKIAKQQKKNAAKAPKIDYSVRGRGPGGANSPAGKAAAASAASPSTGGGGSTTTVVPGSKYVVKRGDTFSAIAKSAGLSLAELRAANPTIMKNKKYKQGSMIWSGTKVNIPKK